MKNKVIFIAILVLLTSSNAYAAGNKKSHSTLHKVVFYIPNRLFDVLDIFRLRVRVGPGISAGVRATKVAQAFVGTHATVYAGLPGPRLRRTPRLPVGLESHNGATLSLADATIDGGIGPNYSSSEIGVGAQIAIVGLDFGFDPVEIADFITGIFTVDIRTDDL